MSAFKPGDVVIATVNGRPNVRLVAGWSRYDPQLRWCELSTRWGDGDDDECWFMPSQVKDHRPLVVIDPEDAEQVSHLCSLLGKHHGAHSAVDLDLDFMSSQAALREFADPKPRIEEPVGLGAVVADADGHKWTRANSQGEWFCECGDEVFTTWDEFTTATKVLSEGVTP